jgi:hypothetical protein
MAAMHEDEVVETTECGKEDTIAIFNISSKPARF